MKVIDDKTVTEAAGVAPAGEPSAAAALPIIEREVYVRGAEIARGGMGRIVEARDGRLGRTVALKEIRDPNPALVRRFEREALISAALEHPAIVAVYEAGRWPNGEPFYAMKRVIGRPLDKVIAESTTLAARLALIPNVLAVFDALAYAHGKGIIHRDLKPANVLVGAYGETVVIDWGLAKDLREADEALVERETDATVIGAVIGTPAYMPPEQARGERVDARADVYALGALLYTVLAGRPPYVGFSTQQILDAVKTRPAGRLRDVPEDLATIVETAMARDPAERYPTASQLAEDLRRFQTGQLVGRHVYTLGELLRRWLRKHRTVVTVAAAMLVVSGVALGLAFRAAVGSRDRAEAEAWATRQTQAAQIVEHAHTMLPIDPNEALATLATLPPDAGADAYAAAWPLAVAAASAPRSHVMFRSPGAAYTWLGYAPDGTLVGLRPIGDRVDAIDRFRDGVVTTEPTPLVAQYVKSLAGARARIHLDHTCSEVDLATGERVACPATPTVTFDSVHHQLVTLGPHGERHVRVLEPNIGGLGVDIESTLVVAPDGSSFVLGINTGQRVTIVSDLALEHTTIFASRLLIAVYTKPHLASVVTEDAFDVLDPAMPVLVSGGKSFQDRATRAVVSSDGQRLAIAFAHRVDIHETSSVLALATAPLPHDIAAIALSSDARSVAVALSDRSVRVLAATGPDRDSDWFEGLTIEADRALYTTRGRKLAATRVAPGSPARTAYLVRAEPETMVVVARTNGASPPLASAGDTAVAVLEDRVLRFDLSRGSAIELVTPRVPDRLALSPDGRTVLGRAGADLIVWRDGVATVHPGTLGAVGDDNAVILASGATLTIGDRSEPLDCTASALAVRGRRIAVGCTNGQVRVIGERRLASVLGPSPVVALAISPTGAIAAVGADPAIQVWTDSPFPILLRGPNTSTTFLQWVNHGDILESATPRDTWLWEPHHGIGAPLTEGHRTMLGDALSLELVEPPRWRLLPTRDPLGFHAWLASQLH